MPFGGIVGETDAAVVKEADESAQRLSMKAKAD
jgi:hypothetical protein